MMVQSYHFLNNVFVFTYAKRPVRIVHGDEMDDFIMYVYNFGLFFASSSMFFLTFAVENPHKNAYATFLFSVFAILFSQLHPICC